MIEKRHALKQPRIGVRPQWIISLFLALSVVAVYHPVVFFDFVNFDDLLYVTDNPHIQDGLSLRGIIWAFKTTRASNWHPLAWLSHMLDCQFYGLNAGMHHATSLIIHTINCLLLFWVSARFTGTLIQSAIVAALFGLHPINVDSVVWIAERKNVLSTFFCMLTLLSYSYYVNKPRIGMYVISLFMFGLGLMTKPIIVSLPFVMLLLDYWPLKRISPRKAEPVGRVETGKPIKSNPTFYRLVLEKIPFISLSILSVGISYIVVQEDSILVTAEMRTFALRLANAVTTYLAYIGKMFWPVNFSIFYPFPKVIPLWKTITAGLLLIGISVYSIQQMKRRPYLGVGWYWYLLALFPFIGQLQAGLWPAMADRWAYIPIIGLFLCVAWGGMEIVSRLNLRKTAMGAIMVILFSALVSRTWSQVLHWQNSITLFEHALAATTDNHVIHNNLANVLEWNGNTVEAEAHYLEALRIEPNFLMARYNLGGLFKSEGRYTEAIEQYREVLRVIPDHAPAHNNLATALINVSEIEKAIADQTQLTERPVDPSAIRKQLDAANRLQDMLDEAICHFKESQRIAPDSDITPKNIKQALLFREKIDEVVVKLEDSLQWSQKTEP